MTRPAGGRAWRWRMHSEAAPPVFGVVRIARARREPWLVYRSELTRGQEKPTMHDIARFDDEGLAHEVARKLQARADASQRRRMGGVDAAVT